MEDIVESRALNKLPHRSMNCIDVSISSYCFVINLPERLENISQANKLESVMCDLESNGMRGKKEEKEGSM